MELKQNTFHLKNEFVFPRNETHWAANMGLAVRIVHIKTGARPIIRLDELSSVARRSRRTT